MYNLATWQQQFRAVVFQQNLQPASTAAISDSEINLRINEALVAIQDEFGTLINNDSTQPVSAGTINYELPPDRIGTTIDTISITQGSGASAIQHPLRYLPNNEFNALYNQTTTANDSGPPRHWTFNPEFNQQALVRPVPTFTGTFNVLYSPSPIQMWRVYNQSAITATVTQGSTTVTLSGQVSPIGNIEQFDEFGTIPTTQADGTAPHRAAPDIWTRIAAVGVANPTVLTLSAPYPKLSGTGLRFITAQVADMLVAAPKILKNTPAIWAAALYASAIGKDDKAAILMDQAKAGLDKCRPKRPAQQTYRDFSMFNRGDGYRWPQYTGGGPDNV